MLVAVAVLRNGHRSSCLEVSMDTMIIYRTDWVELFLKRRWQIEDYGCVRKQHALFSLYFTYSYDSGGCTRGRAGVSVDPTKRNCYHHRSISHNGSTRNSKKKLNHTHHTLTQAKMSICNPVRRPGTRPPVSPD